MANELWARNAQDCSLEAASRGRNITDHEADGGTNLLSYLKIIKNKHIIMNVLSYGEISLSTTPISPSATHQPTKQE